MKKIDCVFEEKLYTSINVDKRYMWKIYDEDGNMKKKKKETQERERKMMNAWDRGITVKKKPKMYLV